MFVHPDTGEVMDRPFVRSPYNYNRNAASDAAGLSCPEPTRTQQQFAEECDINTIVRKFGITGELPSDVRVPQSGDFVAVQDYQSCMNVIRAAEEAFMEMPAEVRSEFDNDPGKFIAFVENPENLERARKLGIAKPAPVVAPEPEPMRVVMVDPPEPKGEKKKPG